MLNFTSAKKTLEKLGSFIPSLRTQEKEAVGHKTGHMGHTVFKCSLPAPEFGVIDVFKFLFADAGYPVSQKFNEVQSGFKRVFKRRHVDVLLQAAVTDCRLTESEEVHLLEKNASVS